MSLSICVLLDRANLQVLWTLYIEVFSNILALPDRIRQMPADLLRFPIRALKVKLAGFRAPSVNKQEDVLPYCPEWSVKAVMEMIDMLHTSVKVTVVVRNVVCHVYKLSVTAANSPAYLHILHMLKEKEVST